MIIFVLGDVWFMKNIDNKRKRKYYFMRLVVWFFLVFRNLVKRMDVLMSEMFSFENFYNVVEVVF